MSTEFKLETDLIVLDQPNALEVFTTPDEVDKIIALVRKKVEALPPMDVGTARGRTAIAAAAFKVTKSKTAIETVGESLSAEAKELPKKIDAGRRRFKEALDAMRDEVRQPLTDWEAKDAERIKTHTDRIAAIRAIANEAALHRSDVETLKTMLAAAEAVDLSPGATEEFADDYRLAKEAALHNVNAAIITRTKYDADQIELTRLRAAETERQAQEAAAAVERTRVEREVRIGREAAEKAQREAQAAAEAVQREEREKFAAREAELQRQTAEAELKAAKIAHEARLAQEAEEQRQRDEAAATAKRAADVEHRRKVNSTARDALMEHASLSKEAAEAVVRAVGQGFVPAMSIRY